MRSSSNVTHKLAYLDFHMARDVYRRTEILEDEALKLDCNRRRSIRRLSLTSDVWSELTIMGSMIVRGSAGCSVNSRSEIPVLQKIVRWGRGRHKLRHFLKTRCSIKTRTRRIRCLTLERLLRKIERRRIYHRIIGL